jgi:hypothetical protein
MRTFTKVKVRREELLYGARYKPKWEEIILRPPIKKKR